MDKERGGMIEKKGIVFCFLFSFMVLINGCETTKGVAQGTGYTVQGVERDTTNLLQMILKADGWMKKNLW